MRKALSDIDFLISYLLMSPWLGSRPSGNLADYRSPYHQHSFHPRAPLALCSLLLKKIALRQNSFGSMPSIPPVGSPAIPNSLNAYFHSDRNRADSLTHFILPTFAMMASTSDCIDRMGRLLILN